MKFAAIFFAAMFVSTLWAFAGDEKKSRGCVPQEKDRPRHEQLLKDKEAALQKGPIQLVFVGDSITEGWHWGGGQTPLFHELWDKYNPYNIGISADETQHVLWRINHGELDGLHPKLVVLLIGTNNIGNQNKMTVEETIDGIHCVVRTIQEKLPDAKLLLLGVFPRGALPTDPFRAMIASINQTISKLDDGGRTVKFLDVSPKFLDAEGKIPPEIMPDGLHPNEKGYHAWADVMGPVIDEMMK